VNFTTLLIRIAAFFGVVTASCLGPITAFAESDTNRALKACQERANSGPPSAGGLGRGSHLNTCTPNSIFLDTYMTTCKANLKTLKCSELGPREGLETCDASSICERLAISSFGFLFEHCLEGFVDVLKDYLPSGPEYWKSFFQRFKGQLNTDAQSAEECAASPTCKKALAGLTTSYAAMNTEELNALSVDQLIGEANENLDRLASYRLEDKMWNDRRQLSSGQSNELPPQAAAKMENIFVMGKSWIQGKVQHWQCLRPEYQLRLACYGFFHVVDPSLGIRFAARLPAWLRANLSLVERRGANLTAAATTRTRQAYIGNFRDLKPTTRAQNENYLSTPAALSASAEAGDRTVFIQNTMLKKMNDTYRNTDLATAMTNRYIDLAHRRMQKLEAANPGLEISAFSDYKSGRIAYRGKVPEDIEFQIGQAFQMVQQDFVQELHLYNVVRASDPVDLAFRAGTGATNDQATLASEIAKQDLGDSNYVLRFSDSAVQTLAEGHRTAAKRIMDSMTSTYSGTPLVIKTEAGAQLAPEVFQLMRKHQKADELALAIRSTYPTLGQFSTEQAGQLLRLDRHVDIFTPSLMIPERNILNFSEARHGGIAIDFIAVGAENRAATAAAINHSTSIEDAMRRARLGEQQVTAEMEARFNGIRRRIGEIQCTGDECIQAARQAMSPQDHLNVVRRLAQNPDTRSLRVTFWRPQVPPAQISSIVKHGDGIEAQLRKSLAGAVDADKLHKITFGVDMGALRVGDGSVNLLVGQRTGVVLTAAERQAIERNFRQTVEAFNSSASTPGTPLRYSVGQVNY